MNFKTYTPPYYLKKYIRYFWSCDVEDSFTNKMILFKNFADRFPRFVFQLNDKPLLMNLADELTPQAYICGIDTHASNMKIEANFSHFGISFHPFAPSQIFKVNSKELLNTNLDLKMLGYQVLVDKLNMVQTHEDRIKIMTAFIENSINSKVTLNTKIQEIILNNQLLEHTDLLALQKYHNITERTLQRLFKTNLGITPKKYQRMVRFAKSLEILSNASEKNTTSIAYHLNYADQPHFINDFKNFSNMTPLEFQKKKFLFSESSAFISKV